MLRPIFDQKSKRNGLIDPELRRALQWWGQILRMKVAERLAWQQADTHEVHMFCDAAGSPPHLAAVLLVDGQIYFTHAAPSQKVMKAFYHRRDNQIMGLELLAISLGLETFKELLSGRRVVIHSDNSGSEVGSFALKTIIRPAFACVRWQVSVRRGTARSWDHAQLVHAQWLQLALMGSQVHVLRVSTDDNIADLPSRGEFNVLRAAQAGQRNTNEHVYRAVCFFIGYPNGPSSGFATK